MNGGSSFVGRNIVSHDRSMTRDATTKRQVLLSALLCSAMLGLVPLAAQGQDAASLTGAKHAEDIVTARQLLMDGIDEAMMPIDLAPDAKNPNLDELKAKAFTINSLISAFPHLFPPQTKPSKDGPSTTATLAIWEDFEKFYSANQAAATTALELGQSADIKEFMERGKQLRAACDGCHAVYMHLEGPHP
jgi:cytochrome c556